ncbi:alpha/beta hydrolase [Maricaulis sp.]|uniref:alpha/beta hydrolase family protein n=1 Tax=Maricaulis sp. TaxID=1486257 RepID=UPI001B1D014C|nr:alpha/beta hydrolase [Maricaulis sp.]MBO6798302.1 alpha/beta hydrolase [Maricaulis sp.]
MLPARCFLLENARATVLISSGTGFPKELYARMARFGAERGYAALIYDYRGIAGSAPEQMRGFDADIMDWARLDFPAALDAAEALAPGKPLFTLGHSVGAHLLGFADNAHKAKAHGFVTAGTGYHGAHEPGYRHKALFFWWGYGPLMLALHNHIPAGGLWTGTALPRDVFTQWRQWSQRPGYFTEFYDVLGEHGFDRISAPIRDWTFTDDQLCSRRSADDLLSFYTAAPTEQLRLDPAELGAKRIDHHGAFSRSAKAFWSLPYDWFDGYL